MMAAVMATYVDGFWQARSVSRRRGKTIGELIPWSSIARTALAAVLASAVVISPMWTEAFGFAGVFFAGATYMLAYVVLLKLLRVPEAEALLTAAWRALSGVSRLWLRARHE